MALLLLAFALAGCGDGRSPTAAPDPSARTTDPAAVSAQSAADLKIAALVADLRRLGERKPVGKSAPEQLASALDNLRGVLKTAEQILAADPPADVRDQARQAALQAMAGLLRVAGDDAPRFRDNLDRLAAQVLAENPASPLAAAAHFWRLFGHINFVRAPEQVDPDQVRALLHLAREFSLAFPQDERPSVAFMHISSVAQRSGNAELAKEACREVVRCDPASALGKRAHLTLRRLDMLAKPLAIAGPSLAGGTVDLNQFKGKVVLVDFWATWCGPCVAEMDTLVAAYDKYQPLGFDIIGVSLDQEADKLHAFVTQRKLPWPQIFFDPSTLPHGKNPLTKRYEIDAIPASLLVDRAGNLAHIDLRGPDLAPAVAALLRSPAPPAD